jgi:hypothetical protein
MVKSAGFISLSSLLFWSIFNQMDRKPLDFSPNTGSLGVRAARLYSDFFSPPSIYSIFAFIIAWTHLPFLIGTVHAAIFGVLTALIPMIYLLKKMKQGELDDIHLSQPGERTVPYLLGAIGSLIAYIALRMIGSSTIFLTFILTVITGLTALALINKKWMVSAHTASITAVVSFVGFVFAPKFALIISPLIISTFLIRLYLKRHTFIELFVGVVLGFLVVSGYAALGFLKL